MEEKEGGNSMIKFEFQKLQKIFEKKRYFTFQVSQMTVALSHFHGKPGRTVATASSPSSTLQTGFPHCFPCCQRCSDSQLTQARQDRTILEHSASFHQFTSMYLFTCFLCGVYAHKVCSVHSFLFLPQQWFLGIVLNGGRGTYFQNFVCLFSFA